MLQLVTYLYIHREDENLVGGKIVLFLRDNMNKVEHDVHLEFDKNLDKHKIFVNGEWDRRFFAEDIFERYAELAKKVSEDIKLLKAGVSHEELELPDRDYEKYYSDERVEELYEAGKISDSKLDKHKKGQKAGDWQCNYCSYESLCYGLGKYAKQNIKPERAA